MIIAGVDEAGRGSVLGPLVIAGVAIEESKIQKLVDMGVKDSKLLSPSKRRKLSRKIRALGQVSLTKIEPSDIDSYVLNGLRLFRLNYLEAKHMAVVLSRLKFDLAFIDCCDTNEKRFGRLVETLTNKDKMIEFGRENEGTSWMIKSEHHADRNHPIVAAASIVAKVTRDNCISRLHRRHGGFGSGYPSDPDTLEFLRGFISKSQRLPDFARTSWRTIERLNNEFEKVLTIDDYQ
jgi:ribonuclease HII